MSEWVDLLCDPGSFAPVDTDESGTPAIDVGVATISGLAVVLAACRFEELAGTLSLAGSRRFLAGVELARQQGLPLFAVANSGGCRMQEGAAAFMTMRDLATAIARFKAEGNLFSVYLAHPTTGGVFASWGSLGHLTFAEPDATIGFTGPRVAAALGEPILPAEIQTAEGLFAAGQIDAVIARENLRAVWGSCARAARSASKLSLASLAATGPDRTAASAAKVDVSSSPSTPDRPIPPRGWAAVVSSRRAGRPNLVKDMAAQAQEWIEISGDRCGQVAEEVSVSIAVFGDRSAVVIGHRSDGDLRSRPTTAGLRLARRGLEIANDLGLAVITVVDTAGARLGAEEEGQGMAGEIARSLHDFSALSVPSLAVIAGQGCGGAALAWCNTDAIFAAEDAWIAPIAPEAGSLIVHRNMDRAEEIADLQRCSGAELLEQGLIDAVVPFEGLAAAAFDWLNALA